MSQLYQNLNIVRTSIMNVIAHTYFDGKQRNVSKVLQEAAYELSSDSFMDELMELSLDELLDLGFEFVNDQDVSDELEGNLMLFPLWLVVFIPNGTVLESLDGTYLEAGVDNIPPYADHWLCAGIRA